METGRPKIKSEVVAPKSKEVKCFKCLGMGHYASQCPNKRKLVMKADGDIDSTDGGVEEEMPILEDASDHEGAAFPLANLSLVIRKALSAQAREDETEQ